MNYSSKNTISQQKADGPSDFLGITQSSGLDNPYSTYNRPTHFTPIWYPDGSYTPYTWLLDCWTPAGMLSLNLTDSVRISGDLWEDWHIAPTN